jgi:nitroreductase
MTAMAASNAAIELLLGRNSAPRLCAPAPDAQARELMFRAALRAPDHARLRPWRFLTIEGEQRHAFGAVLERALLRLDPQADASVRERALAAPLRAPLLVAVFARIQDHPKVPAIEQRLSAGCAAHALLLAAEALGFAGIWRTGNACYDAQVVAELGGAPDEELVAFLYIGTREGDAKPLPALEVDEFVSAWHA